MGLGTKEQVAFKALKDELSKESVLMHFDPSVQIGISCDTANIGIGVVLFHHYPDGSERPIAKVSKMLNPTQCRWSQIHKKALVVVFG